MSRIALPVGKALTAVTALLALSFYCFGTMSLLSFHSTLMPLHEAQQSGIIVNNPDKPSKPTPNSNITNRTRTLLVSAMFPLSRSKHTPEDYERWVSNFLQSVTTEIYFFTTPAFAPLVRRARPIHLPITIDTNYASPFDVPPLKGLEVIYEEMHKRKDRESRIHSPELYAVWNVKPFLLDSAVKVHAQIGKTYDYVFWNDAGSFRGEQKYGLWPDPERLKEIWDRGAELTGTKWDDLVFFPLYSLPHFRMRNWKEDMGPVDYEVSEGSFFGGSPNAAAWWSQIFYSYHDYYLSLGHFVGKDQTLINALFLLFPDRVITVWYRDPHPFPDTFRHGGLKKSTISIPFLDEGYLGACGSEWWYYQFWLSNRVMRDQMREKWLNSSLWSNWRWWRDRQGCRLAGVSSLRQLLQRHFGDSWVPPVRTSRPETWNNDT